MNGAAGAEAPPGPRGRGGSRLGLRWRENIAAWAFLLPSAISLLVFLGIPLVGGFLISLTSWDLLSPPRFVGLSNYAELLRDPLFWSSLRATLYYCVLVIPGTVIASLVLALAVQRVVFVTKIYRTAFFVPVISSTVAVALIWKWLYSDQFGLINFLLSALRLPEVGWLTDPSLAMVSVALLSIWKQMGYFMVIFLAGLQGIPHHLYEAATVDGATAWRRFFSITLPLLSPTTFFVVIIVLLSSFQVFDQVFVLTEGGPSNATLVLNYYLYQNAFEFFRMGYASALAYTLFALILVVTLFQVWVMNKRVHYEQG